MRLYLINPSNPLVSSEKRILVVDDIIQEMVSCNRSFYSLPRILRRVWSSLWHRRQPLISLVGNLSYRSNIRVDCQAYANVNGAIPFDTYRTQPTIYA
jgi:hypothetical protein